MKAGIGVPGLTRVWNSPRTSPPWTFTAPTSVMAQSAGVPPVVSRSTTTKVTPTNGVPRSSSVPCTGCTSVTLTARADSPAQARGRHPALPKEPRLCSKERCRWEVLASGRLAAERSGNDRRVQHLPRTRAAMRGVRRHRVGRDARGRVTWPRVGPRRGRTACGPGVCRRRTHRAPVCRLAAGPGSAGDLVESGERLTDAGGPTSRFGPGAYHAVWADCFARGRGWRSSPSSSREGWRWRRGWPSSPCGRPARPAPLRPHLSIWLLPRRPTARAVPWPASWRGRLRAWCRSVRQRSRATTSRPGSRPSRTRRARTVVSRCRPTPDWWLSASQR